MRRVDDGICWSASDLTLAATCEYAVQRRLDELIGRGEPRSKVQDPLLAELAVIGDQHEAEVRARYESDPKVAAGFVALSRPPAGATAADLHAMHAATLAALTGAATVVFQGGFFDGEFHGFADFLVATDAGWVVSDAKLSRQARPQALLQLACYADQLKVAGVDVAPMARLELGDGRCEEFPLAEIMPVFRERRERLRDLIAAAGASVDPASWGDEAVLACGHCPDCSNAIAKHEDLLLVAGMRTSQRKRLRESGFTTIRGLAAAPAEERPAGMAKETFAKLAAQARLQVKQMDTPVGTSGEPAVFHELISTGQALRLLPAPSPGDIFFDFEGDPLYREDDPKVWGLEYLWGVIEAPADGAEPVFTRWWAHDRDEEKHAFIDFMHYLASRRAKHPDMHVYHYAPYETTALKRLAARYATHETEVDDLLRSAVFVDLYAVVRGAVRVSQPSYSIKKLEPLYMAEEDRAGMEVTAGDASVVEYHAYRALVAKGEKEEAATRLKGLEEYNRYDCISTLALRDWLLQLAEQAGIAADIAPVAKEVSGEPDEEQDATVLALRERSGPDQRARRTADEQAYAMLASAVGYHRRESLPFWWEHFNRLALVDPDDWRPERDVFVVESHEVVDDWHVPPGKQTLRRRLRLRGRWGAGSTPGTTATVVYRTPCPAGAQVPENGAHGCFTSAAIEVSPDDEAEVTLTETLPKKDTPYDDVPVALAPAPPPHDASIRAAVREVAERVAQAGGLPGQPAIDILRRIPPRLAGGRSLPHSADVADDLVEALVACDGSYVPVQGPPGTGKTYTGSQVIARLVRDHGWRIGVVAQSHAVVENMLCAIVEAGLDPDLIGKKDTRDSAAKWINLDGKQGRKVETFLADREHSGCVLGGTAWAFTGNSVERECLDLLVIDEAGQFSLATTVAVSVAARRLLLLGDPQQLPQVSQGTHDEPVDESALGWVMDERDTLPRDLGYFLATTYRMHPELCAKVSTLAYDGELAAAACTAERELLAVAPGLRTVMVDSPIGNAVSSEEEAAVIVTEVQELLGTPWRAAPDTPVRGLVEDDFLVVAPYNAQVQLLRRRLADAGLAGVRVGTVDKFQGQQAPVVLVSMTASSAAEVPRGMRFLLNRNRVNVAISRGQWLAILIRSRQLTSFLPTSPAGLLELGSFMALSDPKGD